MLIDHANLITVYSHGVAPDATPYMVMDFIDGRNMADILGEEIFIEKNRAVSLFLQVCEGVAHAHVNGIVHLDLKPSNVLVTKSDNVEIAKVGDFGIAQMMTDDTQQITQTEEIIGSLPYMSPEHCRGETMDYRSDVYSLGCFMYEVLTGKPPFLGENPVKTIMKHVQEKPKRLRSRLTRLDIPESLEAVVLHCLEKSPSQRYQYVEELIKDLESIRDGAEPVIVRQQTLQKTTEQQPWHGWAIAGSVLTILALYFTHMSQYDSLSQFGYCIGTVGWLVLIGPLIYLCFWMRHQFNAVSIRLMNESTTRPGDNWLQWTIGSGGYALGIIVFTLTVQMFQFNQLLQFPEWLPNGLTWKTQMRAGIDLLLETRRLVRGGDKVFSEELDGELLVEVFVVNPVDRAHAAFADELEDFVSFAEVGEVAVGVRDDVVGSFGGRSGFGRSWVGLGRSWASLGRSWVGLGRSWAGLGRSWASLVSGWACFERDQSDFGDQLHIRDLIYIGDQLYIRDLSHIGDLSQSDFALLFFLDRVAGHSAYSPGVNRLD